MRHARIGLALVILLLGAYLHFHDLTMQVVGGDEEHGLQVALQKNWLGILTHHGQSEHSTLLSLYADFLLNTIGLNEFRLRIPVLLCDVLLLLVPLLFVRRLGWTATLISMALIATSPLVVYYSIVARPYTPAALCILLAVYFWDRWLDSLSRRSLIGFVLTASMAIILHLYSLFPMLALMGLTLLRVIRSGLPQREFWKAGLGISVVVLAVMGPGLPLLIEHRLTKVAEGMSPVVTFKASYSALLGHLTWMQWVFPVLLVTGAWQLKRRAPRLALAFVLLLVVEFAMLWVTRPLGSRQVWARYYFLVWPLALILVALGIKLTAGALCGVFRPGRRPAETAAGQAPALVALALGLGLALAVERLSPIMVLRLYPTSFRSDKSMLHPAPTWPTVTKGTVFRRVRESIDESQTVIVYPVIPSEEWKPLLWYGLHGMYVKFASSKTTEWRKRGMYRTNEVSIWNRDELLDSGARYVIVFRERCEEKMTEFLNRHYGPIVCSERKIDLYDLSR